LGEGRGIVRQRRDAEFGAKLAEHGSMLFERERLLPLRPEAPGDEADDGHGIARLRSDDHDTWTRLGKALVEGAETALRGGKRLRCRRDNSEQDRGTLPPGPRRSR
jgi:hypothetical protein